MGFALPASGASVLEYHNDAVSSGVNSFETTLTTANVGVNTFSKLYSVSVDGWVQAQPLYLPAVAVIGGPNAGPHDLIFVVTHHDSLYAIDAESGTIVWKTSFLDSGLAGATSVTSVPSSDLSSSDVTPEVGICGTPVIDPSTKLLYLVAKTKQIVNGDSHYVNTLYQIDITNGNATADANIAGSTIIGDTICDNPVEGVPVYTYRTNSDPTAPQDPFVAGATGAGTITVNGQSRVYFNSLRQMNRPGLVIANGVVYVAFGSHGDVMPYHGWVFGFDKTSLSLVAAVNLTPNGGLGGVWSSGSAPAVDAGGNVYVMTGNGSFDGNISNGSVMGLDSNNFPTQGDYGDSFVKLTPDATTSPGNQNINGWGLAVTDYFAPFNNQDLSNGDTDISSGGCTLLPDSAGSTAHPHLLIGAGKQGNLYLIDRDNMGKFGVADNVVQSQIFTSSFGTPAFFNGTLYYGLIQSDAMAFTISQAVMSTTPVTTPDAFSWPGATPSISANGTSQGIVWAVERTTNQLRAYSANNLANELWTSGQAANNRDALGTVTKFSTPMVADGRVAVGTTNALVVYGITPPTAPQAAVVTTGAASSVGGSSATLAGTVNPEGSDTAVSFQYGTTTTYGMTTASQDQGQGSTAVNFTQSLTGLVPNTTYHYQAVATSAGGAVDGADKTFKTLPAPVIGTSPAVYLSASGAQIAYSVDPSGLTTTVYIEYGTTTSYGSETATVKAGRGGAPLNLLALLPGLTSGTTYHYKIVTTSTAGRIASSDQTFTTLPFDTTLVAEKSGPIPALAGATYSTFGAPAINDDGYSAFRSVLSVGGSVTAANDMALWADDSSGTPQLVARTGTGTAFGAAPSTFASLGDPVYNNNEDVAFVGTLSLTSGGATRSTETGVWSNSSGNLALVAREGSQAPDLAAGITFAGFTQIGLPDANGVVLLATLTQNAALGVGRANNIGIWAVDGTGSLHLVVRTGDTLNGKTVTALSFLSAASPVAGQARSFVASSADLTYLATFSDRSSGIFDVAGGGTTEVAATGAVAPGAGSATFASFGNPAIAGSRHNAFRGVLAGTGVTTANNAGIWADDNSNTLQLIARTGDAAPATTSTFTALSDPVYNDDSAVLFLGTLRVGTGLATRTNDTGIWSSVGGSLSRVARAGSPAPGCPTGANFAAFSQIALSEQGALFLATIGLNTAAGVSRASEVGIWATDGSGNLQLIVRTGDILNGKTVTALSFLSAVAPVSGQSRSFAASTGNLTYLATFSDRTTGIYSVIFP